MFIGFLYAENFIEFELAFNLEKIDSYDELIDFQLFDSDNDGIDEIYAGFVVDPSCTVTGFRLVVYNFEGNYIEFYFQSNLVNIQVIDYQIINFENSNLLIILYEMQEEWLIRIYDFETFMQICSYYSFENPYHFDNFKDFEVFELNNELQLLLGLLTDYSSSNDSHIERFTYSGSVIEHIETIWDSGYRIINQTENLFTIGYNCEIDIMPMDYEEYTKEYLFSQLNINNTIPSELEIFYEMSGYHYSDQWTTIYDNYPCDFSFLSNNDFATEEYGYLLSEITLDDENGWQIKFTCVDYLNDEIIWEQSYPCFQDMNYHRITASTVLDFEEDSKFVILFWKNYSSEGYHFIVLNRENGNIVLQGEVPYNGCWNYPIYISFFIDRLNDEELLFFTGDGSSLGYDVYIVSEFQVETNDFEIPHSNFSLSNYPNPFNPTTTITFNPTAEDAENTEIIIYNLKGQKVKQFSDIRGQTSVVWDGNDYSNKPVSSGIFFYKLKTANYEKTRKMILLK